MSRVASVTAGPRSWIASDGRHLDVRGLECPDPLVEVLRVLDDDAVTTLIVHLDREPVFLYPELEDRGWAYELVAGCGEDDCEQGVRLDLTRLKP